jgi:hypothetical protein
VNPILAVVLLTLLGVALAAGAAWRWVPPATATDAGRLARWITVGLAGFAGGLLASELYGTARRVHLETQLLAAQGLVGSQAEAFGHDRRAIAWYPALGSILLEVFALVGLAGLVYLVALRRA